MSNFNKKILLTTFITLCFVIFIITITRKPEEKTTNIDQSINTAKNNYVETNNTQQSETDLKITISNKCIGCGKCYRIDPEHFSMQNRRTAIVKSNNNTNSSKLKTAMSNCPVNAISLN